MKINQDLYNGLRIQGPVEYDSKNNVPIKRIRHLVMYICCMEQNNVHIKQIIHVVRFICCMEQNNVHIKQIIHVVRFICCMEQKCPYKTDKTLGQVYMLYGTKIST